MSNESHRRERAVILWPVLAVSVAMLVWMGRSLVTGQIPFTGDLLHWNYPIRDFFAGALARGQRVWWMPSIFGGFDVAGEGQLGVFHPMHWLLYRVLPLDRAFAIEMVLPYVVIFSGTWLFLRRMIGAAPAAFAAMLFTYSGFTLSHGVHMNMVAVVAHLPWLLWVIDRTLAASSTRARRQGTAGIALIVGSQLLSGHPQAVWWCGLLAGSYVLLCATASAASRSSLVAVMVGAVLGAGIGAVQLLATWLELQRSTRLGDDPAFATTFSLPPLQMLQFIEPYLFWGRILRWNEAPGAGDEFAAYAGAVSLALAVWWLAAGRLRRRTDTSLNRFAWWAMLLALFGLWLSIGRSGGLYLVQTWIPVISGFRAPVRYVLFTHFGLAVLAGIALWRLARLQAADAADARRALWAPWALAALSAAAAVWLTRGHHVPVASNAWVAAIGPAVFAAAAALLTLATRGFRPALTGLILLAAADQALYGLGGVIAWQDFVTRTQAEGYLDEPTVGIPTGDGRLARGGFPNLHVLAGYQLIDGYVGLTPKKALDYRSANALRVAGVHYANADFLDGTAIPGAVALGRDWFRLPEPLPRVRLVSRVQVAAQPTADIDLIDVETVALVTHPLSLSQAAPGRAVIRRDDPGEISVDVDAAGLQLLVVSESFDDGWSVDVDRVPAPVEQVNGDFMGVVVPSGQHLVTFRFEPPLYNIGRTVTLLSTGIALVLLVGLPGRSRRGA
ncbi:MAG: YfhO family protein [Vicinamibacterales bacterium]